MLCAWTLTPSLAWATGSFSLPVTPVGTCAPFSVDLSASATGSGLGFDFNIAYNPQIVTATAVQWPAFISDCQAEANTQDAGLIRISIACTNPRVGSGTMASIQFSPVGNGSSALTFDLCEVNEVPCTDATNGQVNVTCFPDPTPTPGPVCTCLGDANKNGFVNFADFSSVQANFGKPASPVTGAGDADCNGFVNFSDFSAVQANFGKSCP